MLKHPSPYSYSSYLLLIFLTIATITAVKSTENMSENTVNPSTVTPSSELASSVYIVYTEKPADDVDLDSFHLSTLSSVLGSEDAAKDSLIYVYKNAASGFSAKLTPKQVSELQKKPGVLQVVPSRTFQLHSGGGPSLASPMML